MLNKKVTKKKEAETEPSPDTAASSRVSSKLSPWGPALPLEFLALVLITRHF